MKPSLGRIVHYRGRLGLQTPRAAIVTATLDTLDPRGVESSQVPPLDSDTHVHLWVFTPSEAGGFAEFNVPQGQAADDQPPTWTTIPPGSWCWPPRMSEAPTGVKK